MTCTITLFSYFSPCLIGYTLVFELFVVILKQNRPILNLRYQTLSNKLVSNTQLLFAALITMVKLSTIERRAATLSYCSVAQSCHFAAQQQHGQPLTNSYV